LIKYCFDKDYNCFCYSEKIFHQSSIEDSWSGEYFYYELSPGNIVDSKEARKYFEMFN